MPYYAKGDQLPPEDWNCVSSVAVTFNHGILRDRASTIVLCLMTFDDH